MDSFANIFNNAWSEFLVCSLEFAFYYDDDGMVAIIDFDLKLLLPLFWFVCVYILRRNSPAPLTDDSSVNFHDVFFFIFCYNLSKNEEKHVIEIYEWVVRNFPVICKWTRWIWPKSVRISQFVLLPRFFPIAVEWAFSTESVLLTYMLT